MNGHRGAYQALDGHDGLLGSLAAASGLSDSFKTTSWTAAWYCSTRISAGTRAAPNASRDRRAFSFRLLLS